MDRGNNGLARRTGFVIVVALAMVMLSPLPMVMQARGATTTGATVALVSAGQLIRDDSTGIPVIGFGASDAGTNEILQQVDVTFNNIGGFAAGDLENLGANQQTSGVAIYRDDGVVNNSLDLGDHPVPQNNIQNIQWNGLVARITFQGPGPNAEPVPDWNPGIAWFIVVRTNPNIATNDRFNVSMMANSITFSNGGGTVTQPAPDVYGLTLTADRTTCLDITAASMGGSWVGYRGVQVNYATPLGIHIVDGGPYEYLTWMVIRDTVSNFNGGDFGNGNNRFWELTLSSATSGIGLYRNNGSDLARFDSSDWPIQFGAIQWVGGGMNYVWIALPAGAEQIPNTDPGTFDYFVIVRTGNNAMNNNQFNVRIMNNEIGIEGIAGDGTNYETSSTPENTYTSPTITVDRANPTIGGGSGWGEAPASPYLNVRGGILYFSDLMGSTLTNASLSGTAADGGSGMVNGVARADFSNEPSLFSSPASDMSPANWYGLYGIVAASNDTSTPATVTIYDRVGNSVQPSYTYDEDLVAPTITPNPGWVNQGGQPPFWIDPSGRMWFSDWITGNVNQRIQLNFMDANAGLSNATSSVEPSLGNGPSYSNCNWGNMVGSTNANNCRADYTFNTTSTDASSPVLVNLLDAVGNEGSAIFNYSEDNEVPVVVVTSPSQGAVLYGDIVVAAEAWDKLTKVDYAPGNTVPMVGVDNSNWYNMYWNGTRYVSQIQTTTYFDGNHRLSVVAWDMVGNMGGATVDVVFANGAPVVKVLAPANGDLVSGIVWVSASVASGLKVTDMQVQIDSGNWTSMSYDPLTNTYYWNWDTSALSGVHSVSVRGLAGSTIGQTFTVLVTVDNTPPTANVIHPAKDAELKGGQVVQLNAKDDVGIGAVYLKIGVGGEIPMIYNPLSGYYEYDWATTATPDGVYDLNFTVEDKVGNKINVLQTSVRVDNTAPTLFVTDPTPNAIITGSYTVKVTSTDTNGSEFDDTGAVTVWVDNSRPIKMTGGPGTWTLALDTSKFNDGKHTLYVMSTDDAGNSISDEFDLLFDNNAPQVALTSPVSGAKLAGVVTVESMAIDTVGVASVKMSVGSASIDMAQQATGDIYRCLLDTTKLQDGKATITLTVKDRVGLTSTATVEVTIDNTGPSISTPVVSGDAGAITIKVTVTDPSGVSSVKIIIGGETYEMVHEGAGSYRYTLFTTIKDNGVHEFGITATDALGNLAALSDKLSVNNPVDYWDATLKATPFLLFLFFILIFIILLLLLRNGKIKTWWTRGPREQQTEEPESVAEKEEKPAEKPAEPEPSKPDVPKPVPIPETTTEEKAVEKSEDEK